MIVQQRWFWYQYWSDDFFGTRTKTLRNMLLQFTEKWLEIFRELGFFLALFLGVSPPPDIRSFKS